MTLEDFFTLTEMKDGLTATARVLELVAVMKNENDCSVKNVNDTTQQWSTVASAIAATENRDCLDQFINLDGLCFIDKWLKDAQKFGTVRGDSFVEESITALLRALENLRIDNQKSVSSGIFVTVKDLLGHSSSAVNEKARALFDSWKLDKESDDVPHEKDEANCNDGLTLSENRDGEKHDISPCSEEKKFEPQRAEVMPLIRSDVHQQGKVDDVQMQKSEKTSDDPTVDGPSIKDPEGQLDTAEFNQDLKEMKIGSSEKLGKCETSPVSSPLERKVQSLCAEATNAFNSAMEPESKEDIDFKTEGPSFKVSEGKSGIDDSESPNLETTNQDNLCNSNALGEKEDKKKSYLSSIEDFGAVDEDSEHDSDEAEGDSGNDSDFFKPVKETKNRDVINKRSDIEELDYGMVDPLEVARQVAIEVEREMDCREASCSSSEKRPDSPHPTNGKQSRTVDSASKEVQTRPDFSSEAPPIGEEAPLNDSENVVVEQENCSHDDMGSSPVTEAVKEPQANAEKGFCDFDLNEEVCSDDTEQPLNPVGSTPVSIVSASRAAAATGLPGSPLQFEGTLGFKGPAATSAFRPASPRRGTEGEKTICTLGTHDNSKQRLDYHCFDLNVAECGDEKPADLVAGKQIPFSSGILSKESLQGKQIPFSSTLLSRESSSVEASPRRSERLHLDLNLVGDGGDAPPLDWKMEGRLLQHRNGLHSPSPSSSSSSMRNIDLNDQPSFLNDSSDRSFLDKPYLNLNPRADDSVISIMGARVEVSRKDFVPQTLSLPNGRTSEPTPDLSLARTTGGILGMGSALPYTHSPLYGYNGYTTGPGPSGPFTSAMYGPTGPIPYMMDSRGAHVVPQILGSASAFPHGFSQQPFLMSMSGAPSGSNGAGPSGHSFDLNSGLIIEGGNRETGGLRQFLNPGQGNSQPSSSSGGKRKEPDSGWEPYPFNYKHHQPPWK